jgi:flagellar L-ring protein precursor FlgH
MTRAFLLTLAIVAMSITVVSAGQQKKPASDNYDDVVAKYLDAARQQSAAPAADANSWINGLMSDRRARQVNDLVTVRVIESISATGRADSGLSKKSSGGAGVTSFFGVEGKLPSFLTPESLAAFTSESDFNGRGATRRTGELSAVMTARVAEVLPNGDLVLEGIREVEINGDRQIVVLTGIARAQDIGPGNVLLSPAIGQMRIRYFGKGLMKDSLSPGWLIRILNKIF